MAQVRVVLPDAVHDAVRVEAARRRLSIAATVAALVGEVVAGPLADGVPSVRAFEVEPRVVEPGGGDRVSREVLGSEWKPAPGLSKVEQAKRGRK